jgi:transcriptional/translational regulatory protein YebC/TACO1
MFDEKGLISVPVETTSFDVIFEAAVEAGAEDVQEGGDSYQIITDRTDLYSVSEALEGASISAEEAKLAQIPSTMVELDDADLAQRILNLIDALEELDDVQEVWANFDISDSVAEQLGGG